MMLTKNRSTLNPSIIVAIVSICLSSGSVAYAQTVKKWVDEEGVTHYSDQAPVDGGNPAEEIELPEANVTEFDSKESYERIQKKLQELERDREAREQEAEQQEETKAIEEALKREPIVAGEKKKKDKGKKYRGPYPMPLSERQRRLVPNKSQP